MTCGWRVSRMSSLRAERVMLGYVREQESKQHLQSGLGVRLGVARRGGLEPRACDERGLTSWEGGDGGRGSWWQRDAPPTDMLREGLNASSLQAGGAPTEEQRKAYKPRARSEIMPFPCVYVLYEDV